MTSPLEAKAKEPVATNSQIKDIYQRNSLYPRTGKRGPKTQARITLAELDALLTRIMLAETQQSSEEAENAKLREALLAHNDILRGAFQSAQRDAIHEVIGTTNYNLLADASSKVLRKYHKITNEARALAAKGGE